MSKHVGSGTSCARECLGTAVQGLGGGKGHSHCGAILVHLQFGDLHVARVNANVNGGACGAG